MKYTIQQYGEALCALLYKKSDAERRVILANLFSLLRKNRELQRLNLILQETERRLLKKEKTRKVEVETPSPLSENIKKEIDKVLGKGALLKERIVPDLLAGMRILVDGEVLIDATAKRRLYKLLSG